MGNGRPGDDALAWPFGFKGGRFDTLERICAALDGQPGDILEYMPDAEWVNFGKTPGNS